MKVRILQGFPYITPHNRELVRLEKGEIIDVDPSHERFAQGWVDSGLAEYIKDDMPKAVEPTPAEGEPEAPAKREAKARKPKAQK